MEPLLLSTLTTHSVPTVQKVLTTGPSTWLCLCSLQLLFFMGAVLIKLQATSPHLNGYIMCCQILASPSVLRRIQEDNLVHPHVNYIFINIYMSLLGFWNLDFFRMVYPPFCLHSNATILQVLSLDYITAAYPLLLILLTYSLVLLHYHNCRLVVCLWRPFLRCCIRFQRQWDIRNSLVDAFATFLLLSYVKFLSVSFDILTPTVLWDSTKVRHIHSATALCDIVCYVDLNRTTYNFTKCRNTKCVDCKKVVD